MNKINEQLTILRKSLHMTQQEFGEHLGVNKATISRLEKKVNNVTNQMAKSICMQFNVNEEWLRNGTGEMYNDLVHNLNLDEDVTNLVELYAQLNQADKFLVKNLMESLAEKNKFRMF